MTTPPLKVEIEYKTIAFHLPHSIRTTARTFLAQNVDDFIDFSYLKNFAHALPEKFIRPLPPLSTEPL